MTSINMDNKDNLRNLKKKNKEVEKRFDPVEDAIKDLDKKEEKKLKKKLKKVIKELSKKNPKEDKVEKAIEKFLKELNKLQKKGKITGDEYDSILELFNIAIGGGGGGGSSGCPCQVTGSTPVFSTVCVFDSSGFVSLPATIGSALKGEKDGLPYIFTVQKTVDYLGGFVTDSGKCTAGTNTVENLSEDEFQACLGDYYSFSDSQGLTCAEEVGEDLGSCEVVGVCK